MDIDVYQTFAISLMSKDLDEKIELATLALGCSGEAGEVADHVKKHIGHGHDLNKEYMIKELGDVLWYIATLADHLDVSLSEIASKNIEKLSKRYPDGFSTDKSINRSQ